jgi:hypothetical protein
MTRDLQYPIGRFTLAAPITDAVRHTAVREIAALPARMRKAVAGFTDAQLDIPSTRKGPAQSIGSCRSTPGTRIITSPTLLR